MNGTMAPGLKEKDLCMVPWRVALALQEHYSTGSTLGLGLPAVKRMADELHIDSAPGQGTRVAATKRIRGKPRRIAVPSRPLDASAPLASGLPCEVGEYIRPMRSQPDCGDATVYIARGNSVLLGIADATGHGTAAGEVARLIRTTLVAQPDLSDLKASFEALHQALKLSVGAACALLHVDLPSGMARYMGVGNTSALTALGAGGSLLDEVESGTLERWRGLVPAMRHTELAELTVLNLGTAGSAGEQGIFSATTARI